MARIDVSELMSDPDFADQITVIRRAETINEFGENVLAEKTCNARAVVQPTTGEALERLPEGVRLNGVITVWTKFELQAQRPGGHADIVVWKDERWQVQSNNPWTNWGKGYTESICIREDLANA